VSRRVARTALHRLGHAAAVVAAGLLLILVTAGPAAAHNRLASSDPADGVTVARTPTAVVLTFDEPAVALGSQVVVTGPAGPAGRGALELVDNTVRQPLAGGAPAGHYTVEWRVTSADGHPVSGSFAFTTEAAGAGQPEPGAQPAPAAAATPAAWPWFLLAAALFALAGTLMVLRRRRSGAADDGPDVSGPAG
jgi:methionine-rich copper-binding protein CopC